MAQPLRPERQCGGRAGPPPAPPGTSPQRQQGCSQVAIGALQKSRAPECVGEGSSANQAGLTAAQQHGPDRSVTNLQRRTGPFPVQLLASTVNFVFCSLPLTGSWRAPRAHLTKALDFQAWRLLRLAKGQVGIIALCRHRHAQITDAVLPRPRTILEPAVSF